MPFPKTGNRQTITVEISTKPVTSIFCVQWQALPLRVPQLPSSTYRIPHTPAKNTAQHPEDILMLRTKQANKSVPSSERYLEPFRDISYSPFMIGSRSPITLLWCRQRNDVPARQSGFRSHPRTSVVCISKSRPPTPAPEGLRPRAAPGLRSRRRRTRGCASARSLPRDQAPAPNSR